MRKELDHHRRDESFTREECGEGDKKETSSAQRRAGLGDILEQGSVVHLSSSLRDKSLVSTYKTALYFSIQS